MARRKLALVENGHNTDDLAGLRIKDRVVLDTETAEARLQMIDRKSDFRMPSQRFETFRETVQVVCRLTRTESAARIGSDFREIAPRIIR